MKDIAHFRKLKQLRLWHTLVTGSGFKELASLDQLERLDLNFSNLNPEHLKKLAGL